MIFLKTFLGSNFVRPPATENLLRHSAFWLSEESHLILGPRLGDHDREELVDCFLKSSEWKGHIWLASSGSQSMKLIGLAKSAFLASAEAVNKHLQVTAGDRWGLCLPIHHVGGLSLFPRAFLSRSAVSIWREKWRASTFRRWLEKERITLLSLVPTQVFDLVQARSPAPPGLRAVVVGGGSLSPEILTEGRILGWPLLPSFGMTEAASQVATAEWPPSSPALQVLPHLEAHVDEDQVLHLRGESLMSGYWEKESGEFRFVGRGKKEWYRTSDRVQLNGGILIPLGRGGDFVKVRGEGFYLHRLEEELLAGRGDRGGALVALPDERDGARLVLVIEGGSSRTEIEARVKEWNDKTVPWQRIHQLQVLNEIPRTDLGKIKRAELTEILAQRVRPQ